MMISVDIIQVFALGIQMQQTYGDFLQKLQS